MSKLKNKDLFGILVVISSAIIFALYPSATKGVYAGAGNAFFVILFTTFWRALSLAGFCVLRGRKLYTDKQSIKSSLTNGIFQTASIIGILGGMVYLPGSIVIVIMFSHTLMIYCFLVFKKEEKANIRTIISVIVALIGLSFVLNIYSNFQGIHLGGLALAFMAAIATALRLYAYGNLVKDRNPAVIGAETFIVVMIISCFGFLFYTPIAPTTQEGWIWAGIAAASLSIGNFGMFYGIRLIGAFKLSFFAKIEPVFATLFSAVLIHEFLEPSQYLGMALIIGSLLSYQFFKSGK